VAGVGLGEGTGPEVGGPCGRGRFIVAELPLRLTGAADGSLPIRFTRVTTEEGFVVKLENVKTAIATGPSLSTF
jgi:hypothetical protein